MSENSFVRVEKLKGRENWDTWKIAAESYLDIKNLWKHVETESTDSAKDKNARSEMIMMVDPVNYKFIRKATSAKQAWANLVGAFEDEGVTRKVAILDRLVTVKFIDCESMEDYVNKKMVLWEKCLTAGFKIDDEIIGALMLAGLPKEYGPLVMAMENSGKKLTADSVQNSLLQHIPHGSSSSEQNVMYGKHKSKPKTKSTVKCFECGEMGHYAKHCKKRNTKEKEKRSTKKETPVLFSSLIAKSTCDDWYIDSGASAHMTMNRTILENVKNVHTGNVTAANNSKMSIECSGDIKLQCNDNNENIFVKNVLYVPDLCTNLISVSQMIKNNNKVVFKENKCEITSKYGDVIATATMVDDMFKLDCKLAATENSLKRNSAFAMDNGHALVAKVDHEIWHRRLGHVGNDKLNKLPLIADGINIFKTKSNKPCVICAKGKQTRVSFPHTAQKSTSKLEIVHTDICGPMSTQSLGGARYYITFIDDYSRMLFVYTMKEKSQALSKFIEFRTMVEKQTGFSIKALQSDNGGEYCSGQFDKYLKTAGILHRKTAPYGAGREI